MIALSGLHTTAARYIVNSRQDPAHLPTKISALILQEQRFSPTYPKPHPGISGTSNPNRLPFAHLDTRTLHSSLFRYVALATGLVLGRVLQLLKARPPDRSYLPLFSYPSHRRTRIETASLMAALSTMETLYASPTQQVSRTSVSPDEHHLLVGINGLQSHDSDGHQAYLSSHWGGSLGSQTSSDDLENYALHSSPTASSLQQTSSTQTSPRSWDSPEQLGPTSWEPAAEQLHTRCHGLDPTLSSHLHNGELATAFSSDPVSFMSVQGFDALDSGCQRVQSQTEPYPGTYQTSPKEMYPSTPESGQSLSPRSTTRSMPVEDAPCVRSDDSYSQAPAGAELGCDSRSRGKKSPTPMQIQKEGEKEEPYAQLIYRAFLSTPRHAMTLQEIYQWFRENTDKGKSGDKGWQNSIRHNLSMNLVSDELARSFHR